MAAALEVCREKRPHNVARKLRAEDAAAEIHLGERFAVGRYNFICNHFREALREAAAELQEAGFSKANEIEERILRTGGCAML